MRYKNGYYEDNCGPVPDWSSKEEMIKAQDRAKKTVKESKVKAPKIVIDIKK